MSYNKVFWEKVLKCEHKNRTEHYEDAGSCGTPYCDMAYETRCADCGVFIIECACHFCDGLDGWSYVQRRRHERRKENKK